MRAIRFEVYPDFKESITDAIEVLAALLPLAEKFERREEERFASSNPGTIKYLKASEVAAGSEAPKSEPVSGDELRKAAGAKAKAIGAEKVKAFVASLGVKTIADVAPEDSADVLARLNALT